MSFLRKNFRPWSFFWIIQRIMAVIREGRLHKISLGALWNDLNLFWKLNIGLKGRGTTFNLYRDRFEDDDFNFRPDFEYNPFLVNENPGKENLSFINDYFDKIYVLNLGHRIDRRVEMIQKLIKYNIRAEIIKAEDGYTLENQADFLKFFNQPVGSKGTHPLERSLNKKMIASPGAWGYLKSYKKIILDAKRNDFHRILCLDDDVIFHQSFEQALNQALQNIPEKWKLLYLGASQHDWNVPGNVNYPENISRDEFETHPYYFPVRTDGSFAVGIDSSVYDEILEEIGRMNCTLDSGPLRSIQQKYIGQCFVLNPNLVVADVSRSDIGEVRDQEIMAKKFRWKMGEYDHPFRKELVSVIMPAYNAEKTIEKSIRSILLQNYREFELIVADDASTDSTPDIVQRLAQEDSRVKHVRLETNQGCYPARNAALRASSGKYIAFQDSDDISLSTRIETQLVPILLGKAEFTLSRIFRSRCTVDELDVLNQKEMIRLVLDRRVKTSAGLYEYLDKPVLGLVTSMFTRRLFEEYGLFWESRFGADAEFLERVLFHKTGIILSKKDKTIHSYLMERDSSPGVYRRIDKVQLISAGMTGDNITNRHSLEEKSAFEDLWRKRLKQEIEYIYPTF